MDKEPIQDGWRRDPGQDRSQTRTAVGERGHFSVVGAANSSKISTDQRREVGVSLCDCAEHMPASACSFDIADADLQVPADPGMDLSYTNIENAGCLPFTLPATMYPRPK